MQEGKTEGIVLRSQDYKERQRIITVFTPLGVISLIVKGISHKNTHLLSLTTPFCQGEYHFLKKNSELLNFQDGVILNEHLVLRQSLQFLKTAGLLAQTILRSQWPGKSSEALFSLYKAYHAQVSHFSNWQALLGSFYMKLLKVEGVLTHLSFNLETLSEGFASFSSSELQTLRTLVGIQRFSLLQELPVSEHLLEKIQRLLVQLIGLYTERDSKIEF